MKKLMVSIVAALAVGGSASAVAADYANSDASRAFAQRMAEQHGFDAGEVEKLLAGAKRQQAILDAISRPAEKSKPWYEYRKIFLDDRRINDGVAFWREHEATLQRAQRVYGVSPEIIVAVIGVETRYGAITGNYRVLDALATLGFDYPPRAAFFSKELEHFLLLAREQGQDVNTLKGSYAGAMGYGQFMPSSYRAYAADFDDDGVADIWTNPTDAIGSVANYFKVHGWVPNAAVMLPAHAAPEHQTALLNKIHKPDASLEQLRSAGFSSMLPYLNSQDKAVPLRFEVEQGDEYWLGLQNFYVITRYNRSPLYARAVWELAEAIKAKRQVLASASDLTD